VLFLGLSPGGSPPRSDTAHGECPPYELPGAGGAHPGPYFLDTEHDWDRVRELGSEIIQAHAPEMSGEEAHALIGQLNLSTKQSGEAKSVPFETDYCRWVPEAIIDQLRPGYVILLGLKDRLKSPSGAPFDPDRRLGIDWRNPEQSLPFAAYQGKSTYTFGLWRRKRPDGQTTTVVLWPQHPSRHPMTIPGIWPESGREFILQVRADAGN
jgi:hypothetical protein